MPNEWLSGCDAILIDIKMPKLDGYQATKEVRSSGCPNARTISIIAMTANAFREDVALALEAGMNAHIAKPIDVEMLYQTLEDAMKHKITTKTK